MLKEDFLKTAYRTATQAVREYIVDRKLDAIERKVTDRFYNDRIWHVLAYLEHDFVEGLRGTQCERFANILGKGLSHDDFGIRQWSCHWLRLPNIGGAFDARYVPTLQGLLSDNNGSVKRLAEEVLSAWQKQKLQQLEEFRNN